MSNPSVSGTGHKYMSKLLEVVKRRVQLSRRIWHCIANKLSAMNYQKRNCGRKQKGNILCVTKNKFIQRRTRKQFATFE